MKKIIVLAIVAMMVMVFAASANAYLIKVQSCAPVTGASGSATGQLGGGETALFTPLAAALNPEASYAVFSGNDPVNGTQGFTLKLATAPALWYGKVVARGGYEGSFDLRFFSTTTTSKLTPGTWYLYKGIQTINAKGKVAANALDFATFTTAESTYAGSTFGAILNNGDYWTLTTAMPDVPEPGSILALASGLVGLVGFGIRRRK